MKNQTILVVAAHPDDELLGAGGTLIKHALAGDSVYCLILGEGVRSRSGAESAELKKLRADAVEAGCVIGFKEIFFEGIPDNAFDTVSLLSITKVIEKYLEQVKPDIIYTHFENDLNIDHRLAFQAVMTAARPCNADCPAEIYTFETLSSTEWQSKLGQVFRPNHYVNVEQTLDKKITAMRCYKDEIRSYPHSRSAEGIKILAEYRGLESGLKAAEAFCLVRKIIK
ncbi:MAG: PIG-L family deacetylase [bacterium]|nr:PIG-L family deacetylase [bacterium]